MNKATFDKIVLNPPDYRPQFETSGSINQDGSREDLAIVAKGVRLVYLAESNSFLSLRSGVLYHESQIPVRMLNFIDFIEHRQVPR